MIDGRWKIGNNDFAGETKEMKEGWPVGIRFDKESFQYLQFRMVT